MAAALGLSLFATNSPSTCPAWSSPSALSASMAALPMPMRDRRPARSAGHVRARRDGAARAGDRAHVAADLCGGGGEFPDAGCRLCSPSTARSASTGRGYVESVDAHPPPAAWLSYGYTMIRWPIFAIPVRAGGGAPLSAHRGVHLCVRHRPDRDHAGLGLVPAIGVYQQIGLDPATLKHLDPRAYLDQLRDLRRCATARCVISICLRSPAS